MLTLYISYTYPLVWRFQIEHTHGCNSNLHAIKEVIEIKDYTHSINLMLILTSVKGVLITREETKS